MAAMTSQSMVSSSPSTAATTTAMVSQTTIIPCSSPAINNSSSTGTGGEVGLPDSVSAKCAFFELDRNQMNSCRRNSFRSRRTKIDNAPQDEIAVCRTSGRCCGSIQDLLESFHTAFSDDQVWAIIFQFMNLYRNAIVLNGGRGGSPSQTTTATTTTPRRKSKSGTGSAVTSLLQKQNIKKCNSPVTPKNGSPKINARHGEEVVSCGSQSSSTSSGSDSECIGECPSDSDNSDIHRRSANNSDNSNLNRNGKANGAVLIENSNSSDEYSDDDGADMDSDKRSSRLDHVDYLNVPTSLQNFHIHKDGSVHVSYTNEGEIRIMDYYHRRHSTGFR